MVDLIFIVSNRSGGPFAREQQRKQEWKPKAEAGQRWWSRHLLCRIRENRLNVIGQVPTSRISVYQISEAFLALVRLLSPQALVQARLNHPSERVPFSPITPPPGVNTSGSNSTPVFSIPPPNMSPPHQQPSTTNGGKPSFANAMQRPQAYSAQRC